jgi:uncharacterized phage protein gp47/JayE
MSYAAEPYGIFVEDLLANLTGGVSRIRFRFVEDEAPFSLGPEEHVRPETVRVHGIADGAFRLFVRQQDFTVDAEGTITWREGEPGRPAADATWPDEGSIFWVAFEREPGHVAAPTLTDRNPGSVVRTLAESFAHEYAVFARQLELVYQGGHLATASGSDLEHLATLVGVTRRSQTHARGEAAFLRTTPAAADIAIPAGTRISTKEPPLVTCETTSTVILRRGTQSVAASVRALAEGPAGVTAAGTLTVLHRPILGIEEVTNPLPLSFGGGAESDAELRERTARALQTQGRSTVAAIRGALASLDGIRDQDILIEEDHLAHPGVVKLTVAADPESYDPIAAVQLLEDHRPAGIRITHNLPVPTVPLPTLGGEPGGGGEGPTPDGAVVDGAWFPVAMTVAVTPQSAQLTQEQRGRLQEDVAAAVRAAVEDLGVGDALIYNRLVAAVIAVEGVLDVVPDVAPIDPATPGAPPSGRFNLRPAPGTRVQLAETDLTVTLRGALVALDVSVEIQRLGLAAAADAATILQAARADIERRLTEALAVAPNRITPPVLLGLLPDTEDYRVTDLGYGAELMEEGLRVVRPDVTIDLTAEQQPWIRKVSVTEAVVS